jgi:polyphosphate kinase 2 (PPK2 family)
MEMGNKKKDKKKKKEAGEAASLNIEEQSRDMRDIDDKIYDKELLRLETELVKLQDWVTHEGKKIVVLFEGRDAAGKGGMIKRITEPLNHRMQGRRPRGAD